MHNRKSAWIIFFLIGAGLLTLDLFIKWIMNTSLELHHETRTFLPNVSLFLTHNKGYHYLFGEISNYTLFNSIAMIMAVVFIVMLILNLRKVENSSREMYFTGIILSCLLGAVGNPLEALITGKVTDWFIFRPFPWPSNLADQYVNFIIWIMLPLTIISEFLLKKKEKKERIEKEGPDEIISDKNINNSRKEG